jgi:hypothetical protein
MQVNRIEMTVLNFQKPSHELSTEEILGGTFDIYSKNFVLFFTPFLIAGLISGILSIPILSYMSRISQIDFTGPPDVVWSQFLDFFLTFLALVFVLGIISWIIGNMVSGVCVKCASDLIEKGKASLGESFNFTVYKLPSLLIATLVIGILTVLGLIALIVPGVILYIMFYLAIPAIMIEDVGAFDSLSRSRKLVSNRWLKTFVLALIVGLIIGVAAFAVNLITIPLGIYGLLVGSVINAFVQPISLISSTVYYYAMSAKEEQRRIPPPPPPPF